MSYDYFYSLSEQWLNDAQKSFLLSDFFSTHTITLRKNRNIQNYYTELESFLRKNSDYKIVNYRDIKEEHVKVSRPSEVCINLDFLLQKRPSLILLKKEILNWRTSANALNISGFVEENYYDCIRRPQITTACFSIFRHLLTRVNSEVWVFPRQLGHTESTKIIGNETLLLKMFSLWRKEDATWADLYRRFKISHHSPEFQIFAPNCRLQQAQLKDYYGIILESRAKEYNFCNLKQTLIIENKESFKSLSKCSKNTLLVFGSGWKVSQIKKISSLFPKPIYYWGDIDKEGFEIFQYLKVKIPELIPIMMGQTTYDKYKKYAVTKNVYYGPYKDLCELQDVYETVCKKGVLIEQEKIPLNELPLDL